MNRYTTHNMDNLIHYYTIQVIPILVEDCQSLRDCTSCAASRDPLCGWCSIEKKCSRRSECSYNTETRRWIQEEDMCLVNFAISPNTLPVEQSGSQVCNYSYILLKQILYVISTWPGNIGNYEFDCIGIIKIKLPCSNSCTQKQLIHGNMIMILQSFAKYYCLHTKHQ